MWILVVFFAFSFLYCLITLSICSFFEYFQKRDGFIFPLLALFKESILQVFVFIFLPIETILKWEKFHSSSNKIAILLPGYTETQFIFWKIRKDLKKINVGYRTIRYKPFLGDLNKHMLELKMEIEKIIEKEGKTEVYLIGHSMGGLIGRSLLENYPNLKVELLVMIATPHKGTILGGFGLGKSAQQLSLHSDFIKSLKPYLLKNAINIYTQSDSLICPRDSCIYLGNNWELRNKILHNSTLFNKETSKIILQHISYGINNLQHS